jgi:hypothetical protein
LILEPGATLGDVDALLKRRGLDPDEWTVERVTVNEWEALAKDGDDNRVVQLHQLKAHLRRRWTLAILSPAVEVAQRHVPVSAPTGTADRLVWVAGDQQAPYHDEQLHAAVLRWLHDVKPDEGVLHGDTQDFSNVSKHPDKRNWNATVQECVNSAYRLLSDYRDAAPSMRLSKLLGNHDWRLEAEMMSRAERTAYVTPAYLEGETPEPFLYSPRRLLHLDRLGIILVGEEGENWDHAEVKLTPSLSVKHKAPAQQKLLRMSRSLIVGDSHRQSVEHITCFDSDDRQVIRTLVHAGCLCDTGGLGYTKFPDWQPGFATAAIAADGTVSYELATWRNGRLTWRGESW